MKLNENRTKLKRFFFESQKSDHKDTFVVMLKSGVRVESHCITDISQAVGEAGGRWPEDVELNANRRSQKSD